MFVNAYSQFQCWSHHGLVINMWQLSTGAQIILSAIVLNMFMFIYFKIHTISQIISLMFRFKLGDDCLCVLSKRHYVHSVESCHYYLFSPLPTQWVHHLYSVEPGYCFTVFVAYTLICSHHHVCSNLVLAFLFLVHNTFLKKSNQFINF